jgi:hypothetical protein
MSREHTAACRARQKAGKRVVLVEIDDAAPDALIQKGLLDPEHEEDWQEIGRVVSKLFAAWLDELS